MILRAFEKKSCDFSTIPTNTISTIYLQDFYTLSMVLNLTYSKSNIFIFKIRKLSSWVTFLRAYSLQTTEPGITNPGLSDSKTNVLKHHLLLKEVLEHISFMLCFHVMKQKPEEGVSSSILKIAE